MHKVFSVVETEIKLAISDVPEAVRAITAAGFALSRQREFERNSLFDTPLNSLRTAGLALRLRLSGSRATLTQKGPTEQGKHKIREEHELDISDPAGMERILQNIGFQPSFLYEKYRTEFRPQDGTGVIMLDETPIGNYLELEGDADWIDRTARHLGFEESDFLPESYSALYRKYCDANGITPTNMIFTRDTVSQL